MNDTDIVHLCADGVHAISGWACQYLVFAWCTKTSEEVVYCFVGSNAYEEICRCEILGRVGMSISQGAEEVLEIVLVGIWIAIEAYGRVSILCRHSSSRIRRIVLLTKQIDLNLSTSSGTSI